MHYSLIDTHTHVQFPAFAEDREAVISRARDAGIGMVNVGTQYSTSVDAIELARAGGEGLFATIGFHPGHADPAAHHDKSEFVEKKEEVFDADAFRKLATDPVVVGIGECGLDYYRMKDVDIIAKQKDIFRAHIALAREAKKPLVIHCREAFPDLIEILRSETLSFTAAGNGIIHFFSGTVEDARSLLGLGFFLGFGGVITFARDYDEVLRFIPLDRIVVETDAPYVAPVPYRGKRNEPLYVIEAARKIAELRGESLERVSEGTLKNSLSLLSPHHPERT